MAESDPKSAFDTAHDAAEEARLDALAEAEIDAGQFVTHKRVGAWLRSWGTPNELPCPMPDKT